MDDSTTRIAQLAALISDNTAIVDAYLKSHHQPTPSFNVDGPLMIPIPAHEVEIVRAQDIVIASTQELHNLMKGPATMLIDIGVINPNDVLSLGAIYRYKVASSFPLNETISFEALSTVCGLNEIDLRRLIRHAMTNHIFQEREGRVAHTAASRILAENSIINDNIGVLCEEMFPGAARTVDALKKYNGARKPSESGWTLGHNTSKGLYDELSLHPERGRRFAGAMSSIAARGDVERLAKAFNWDSCSTVVDVGGGWAPASIALAQRFSGPTFVVQDIMHVAPGLVPHELKDRIVFAAHDFFMAQDIKGADAYLIRHVLHKFPDDACKAILRAQIPALRHGAHIIVEDVVVPEPRNELPAYKEKYQRSMGLVMLTLFGTRERTLRDWTTVIKEADSRFDISYNSSSTGLPSNIIVIKWLG